jgi:hypothetical protein
MSRHVLLLASLSFCAAACLVLPPSTFGQTVTKIAEDFEHAGGWAADPYNSGSGEVNLDQDVPQGTASTRSMKLTAHFPGTGFQNYSVQPASPLIIPGDAKEITIHYKLSDERYTVTVGLIDGYGRGNAPGGGYYIWKFGTKTPGQWATATYKIPADMVRPIRIAGIGVENWEAKGVKNDVTLHVDDLQATTDITHVDRKTGLLSTWQPDPKPANPDQAFKQAPATPLIDLQVATGQPGNLFAGA